ncbi:MAG: DUF4339 domain-containing protein [Chlamydiae bacterium]|jgi:hypothetical protein|nr:DUF4339 domain-containing protein [Chlamydiota bacterium]
MDREWFILVRGEKKGPFSLLELKQKYTITPDTFVWKKGFSNWKKAGKVKEFEKFFKDEEDLKPSKKKISSEKGPDLVEILTLRFTPGNFFWWILLVLLILLYSIFKLYQK